MATLMATLGLDSQGFDRGLNSSTEKIKSWAQAFGLVLSAGTIANLTKQAIDLADGFDRMALRTGLSREAVQEWSFVVTNSKANVRDFEAAVVALATRMTRQPELFEKYGIAIRNTDGTLKSVEEVLRLVSQRMGAATGESEKNAIAMDTMAEAGRKLVIALGQNEEVISELIAKAPLMRDATVQALAEMQQAMDNLKLESLVTIGNILGGLRDGDAGGFMRSLGEISNVFAKLKVALLDAAAGFVDALSNGLGFIINTFGGAMDRVATGFINKIGQGVEGLGNFLPDRLGGDRLTEIGRSMQASGSNEPAGLRERVAATIEEVFSRPGELARQIADAERAKQQGLQSAIRSSDAPPATPPLSEDGLLQALATGQPQTREQLKKVIETAAKDAEAARIKALETAAKEIGTLQGLEKKYRETLAEDTDIFAKPEVNQARVNATNEAFLSMANKMQEISPMLEAAGIQTRAVSMGRFGASTVTLTPDAIAQQIADMQKAGQSSAALTQAAAAVAQLQSGAQATPSTAQQVGAGAQVNPAATMYVDLTGRSLQLLEGRYKAQ